MKSSNQAVIQKAFTQQASGFESSRMNFTKQDYLDYAISKISPSKSDSVLEVAAGTCICGRAIAPYTGSVTCLDLTPAMLSKGKTEAEKCGIPNISFVLGDAAELPFLDNSFDVVLSRLAFHHFPDVEQPFAEMVRVLKPGGRLVMIDLEAPEENLRHIEDEIEIMRDPSHVHNLSKAEMLRLYEKHGIFVKFCETVKMPMKLQNWMEHTQTPQDTQADIIARMKEDINGGAKTGFYPYQSNGEIQFDHRWVLIVGTKKDALLSPLYG